MEKRDGFPAVTMFPCLVRVLFQEEQCNMQKCKSDWVGGVGEEKKIFPRKSVSLWNWFSADAAQTCPKES